MIESNLFFLPSVKTAPSSQTSDIPGAILISPAEIFFTVPTSMTGILAASAICCKIPCRGWLMPYRPGKPGAKA